jgi:6-phosphofructokinase 1
MLNSTNTRVQHLGPCRFKSPLELAPKHGNGLGTFVPEKARVRYQVEFHTAQDLPDDIAFEKAGPREKIFFRPDRTRAAIVTCGGLCPGLNDVVRSAVLELYYNYGVRHVLGIRYGYAGLNPRVGLPPLPLTPDFVSDIQEEGGTVLGTSRGPQDTGVMVDFLTRRKINILLCVGGDGTLRGARDIATEARRRGLALAVVGVPKTIDNDVMYVTRTFGMTTAVSIASWVLDGAHAEARSVHNGIGLVKVMGRHAGYIAAGATLASQEVNYCLIPEVPFEIKGRKGLLEVLRRRLEQKRHAVILVAEGAGQELIPARPGGTDASGNKRLGDIGLFLKDAISEYFKRVNVPVDVKYFDPSYVVRSVPACSEDALLCDQLSRHAVHAAMAGKTNMVVGLWNGTFTHLPISLATSQKKHVDPEGRLWSSVLAATGQPRNWK